MTEPDLHAPVRTFRERWNDGLPSLFQSPLLTARDLEDLLKKTGFRATRGDVEKFGERGWLRSDATRGDGEALYHPFRAYVLGRVLMLSGLNITPSSTLNRERLLPFLTDVVEKYLPSIESLGEFAERANDLVELPILLDPPYWGAVIRRERVPLPFKEEVYRATLARFEEEVKALVAESPEKEWKDIHFRFRLDASELDDNHELYLLLRLAPWDKRETLKGRIAGALRIRHMAEVLRLAFEDVHETEWEEEDRSSGTWFRGARVRLYGAERPLDSKASSRRYLAFNYGLHTGAVMRWYVEGWTELGAVMEALPGAAIGGIELVNLKGSLETKPNVPMKLADGLEQDRTLRRFSFVSIDLDEQAAVRTLRRQVQQGNVVGAVAAYDPDFEFGNFTIDELVEVAARLDERDGLDADAVRSAGWAGVSSGRDFENRYSSISKSGRSLKGTEWGAALARYSFEHPDCGTGERRPFLKAVEMAMRSLSVRYDYHAAVYRIDPSTFELVRMDDPPAIWRV